MKNEIIGSVMIAIASRMAWFRFIWRYHTAKAISSQLKPGFQYSSFTKVGVCPAQSVAVISFSDKGLSTQLMNFQTPADGHLGKEV